MPEDAASSQPDPLEGFLLAQDGAHAVPCWGRDQRWFELVLRQGPPASSST